MGEGGGGVTRKADSKRRAAKIATVIVMSIVITFFVLDMISVLLSNAYEKRFPLSDAIPEGALGSIHFINTDNSDCILLESDGHFALIDSGWGSNNPNEKASRDGYEQRILDYLKQVAADENGMVTLDFVLPTHYHYDHAGGFPLILADSAVQVGTVYLRDLRLENQIGYEIKSWGIQKTWQDIKDIVDERGFLLRSGIPDEPFTLGNMTLQFYNTDSYDNPELQGENDNTIVTLVTCGGSKTLLTGDATALHGLEQSIAKQVGQVDVLKVGHHGYAMSSSLAFLLRTKPKLAVVTNGIGQVYPNVRWNFAFAAHIPLYSTARENGIKVTYFGEGKLWAAGNLQNP